MAVYVDELRTVEPSRKWRYREACHLLADTLEELHAAARGLGLKPEWFQVGRVPHYDVTARKRALAIVLGAGQVPKTKVAELVEDWQDKICGRKEEA